MNKRKNSERILFDILGALARMALMTLSFVVAYFATILSFDSGLSIKNLINAFFINLIIGGLWLLSIWGWTPKWQRPWWISAYLVLLAFELFLFCFI